MARSRPRRRRVKSCAAETKTASLRQKAAAAKDKRLAKALAAWARLSERRQRLIAEAVVETRHEELRRAYPDIVGIGFGRRSCAVETVVTDEVAITFMVARKRKRVPRARRLPEFLLTYGGSAGEKKPTLYAIPTDIKAAYEYRIRPHCAVRVRHPQVDVALEGVLTCLATVPGLPETFALSCHHVLCMSVENEPQGEPVEGALVLSSTGEKRWGVLSSWRGQLVHGGDSFDAALAEIEDKEAVASCLGHSPRAIHTGAMPYYATIRTPRGDAKMELVEQWKFAPIEYFRFDPQPEQEGVSVWKLYEPGEIRPDEGDSGSPLYGTHSAINTLYGMYIGGSEAKVPNEKARFCTLPLQRLVALSNYGLTGQLRIRTRG